MFNLDNKTLTSEFGIDGADLLDVQLRWSGMF